MAQRRVEPFTNRRNDLRRDVVFTVRFQRLYDEAALRKLKSCLLQCGVLECERRFPGRVRTIRAVGQIEDPSWDLRGESEEVLSCRAVRLYTPAKLSCKSVRDLIDVWTDSLLQYLAIAGIVVDASNDAPDQPVLLSPMKS